MRLRLDDDQAAQVLGAVGDVGAHVDRAVIQARASFEGTRESLDATAEQLVVVGERISSGLLLVGMIAVAALIVSVFADIRASKALAQLR